MAIYRNAVLVNPPVRGSLARDQRVPPVVTHPCASASDLLVAPANPPPGVPAVTAQEVVRPASSAKLSESTTRADQRTRERGGVDREVDFVVDPCHMEVH